MFDLTKYEDAEALDFGMVSCVGVMANKFPLDGGNYFSVYVGDTTPTFLGGKGQEYEIVNMWHENLEHLVNKGEVSFPIKIKLLTKRCAIVVDPRVDPNYLCEITYRAPMKFWSLTALTKRQMEIDSGVLKVIDNGDGMILESREIKTKNRTLETKWTVDNTLGPSYTNDCKNIKELTQELKDYYWKLAEEKIESDNKKIANFIKENNLASTSMRYHKEGEDYAYTVYEVAKKMWEADGYVELPSKFVGNKEREKEFTQNIFEVINDKFINESQEEMDKSFLKLVDKIVERETK